MNNPFFFGGDWLSADCFNDNKEDSSAKADTSATTETENTEEEKGCSSTVTGSVIALIAVIGAGSAVVMRKKED